LFSIDRKKKEKSHSANFNPNFLLTRSQKGNNSNNNVRSFLFCQLKIAIFSNKNFISGNCLCLRFFVLWGIEEMSLICRNFVASHLHMKRRGKYYSGGVGKIFEMTYSSHLTDRDVVFHSPD